MNKPQFISKLRRTYGGALPTSVVQQVSSILLTRGFVLLPSDTCYSLGALAIDESVRNNLNMILNRKDDPISIAFSSYRHVQRFVQVDNTTALLLERFTPGPITIVRKATDAVSRELLAHYIGSPDETIGARIPDSYIERDIAACTQYPLMTVAVRDFSTGLEIRRFDSALAVVSPGLEQLGNVSWAAIEGDDIFYHNHSSVVRVEGVGKVKSLRHGDIPIDEIESAIKNVSLLAIDDWT